MADQRQSNTGTHKTKAAYDTLVDVRDLEVHFPVRQGMVFRGQSAVVRAVDGVSFSIVRGRMLGLVGESGCGKSTTGRALLQLLRPTNGQVIFEGVDLTTLRGEALRQARRKMQMVFQDPYASLNPRMTVGEIVGEPLEIHGLYRGAAKQERIRDLLVMVGLAPQFVNRYPHEFSGGQRQRIGIARALAVQPAFIVCDEPISALDVSIQAQVINLLMDLQEQLGLTYLLIAHDLSVIRHVCDDVAVMYLGKIVEMASREALYDEPRHPYTRALLSAVPIPDPVVEEKRERIILTGDVPSPVNPPSGCRFRTRCWMAQERCRVEEPAFREVASGHWVACHFAETVSRPPPTRAN